MRTAATLKDGILWIKVTGEAEVEDAVRVFAKMCGDAAARKARGVLMDLSKLTGNLTGQERLELGSRVAACAEALGGAPRIAVLNAPPTVDGFAAMVAQNRGVTVELFDTPEEALEWLKK